MKKPPKVTWKSALRLGRARKLTPDMRGDLQEAATDWRVCAVGERLGIWYNDQLYDAIGPAVATVDKSLYNLGGVFTAEVNRGRWAAAERIRHRIVQRMSRNKIEKIRVQFRKNKRQQDRFLRGLGL